MKLKIRCDYKKQKLHIETDSQHLTLMFLILAAFDHSRKNRYSFLLGLGLLLTVLLLMALLDVSCRSVQCMPALSPVLLLLACSICKQGPPNFLNVKRTIIKLRS